MLRASFDEPYWVARGTNAAPILASQFPDYRESWSGYSLSRTGSLVSPFLIPAVESTGRTNLTLANGSIRLWFRPGWTSAGLGGQGPGCPGRLLEIASAWLAPAGVWWSLYFSPDGDLLYLSAQAPSQPVDLLQTAIAWQAGDWHLITLNYTPTNTALYLDGALAAQGAGPPLATAPGVAELALGSDLAGGDPAQGEFDDLTTFPAPRPAGALATYYASRSRYAALGPIVSWEAELERLLALATEAESGGGASSGGLRGNGLGLQPQPQSSSSSFELRLLGPVVTDSGTNTQVGLTGGELDGVYDLFFTTNLLPDLPWSWIARGLPGQTNFVFTNLLSAQGYFLAATTNDSDANFLSDAYEALVLRGTNTVADSDSDGIPDDWELAHGLNPLLNDAGEDPDDDGSNNKNEYDNHTNPFDNMLLAWGDNRTGQSSVPTNFGPVVAMAGGGASSSGGHTLALTPQGTVVAWGDNTHGQTNVPAGLTNVIAVSAGGDQSVALLTNGTVVHWGRSFSDDWTNLTAITAISAGYQHVLALQGNGAVVTWGHSNCPARWVPDGLTSVKAIAAGWNHNLALKGNGTVVVWGLGETNLGWQLTNAPAGLTNIAAISAGALHSVALRSNGTVIAWGYSKSGETNVPAGLSNVVAIAAGRGYTLALKADGTVTSWGVAAMGVPEGLVGVSAIAAGPGHALATRTGWLAPLIGRQPQSVARVAGGVAEFTVWVASRRTPIYQWYRTNTPLAGRTTATNTLTNVGTNDEGGYHVHVSNVAGAVTSQEAEFVLITRPVVVYPTTPQNVWVMAGMPFTLSNRFEAGGSRLAPMSYRWTKNGAAKMGPLGPTYVVPSWYSSSGAEVTDQGTYVATASNAAGDTNSAPWRVQVALPGSAGLWGLNDAGQAERPFGLKNVVAVAGDTAHSLVLQEGGAIVAWGDNTYGQTNVPAGLTNVVAISAGGRQSLALLSNTTVVQWGETNALLPGGLTGVKAIASGTNFHLALLTNGTVVAWGSNNHGQVSVPTNLANVVAIAAGGSHALALRENGTVTGWGDNTVGQCSPPSDLTNAMAVAAGAAFSLALRNDSTVIGWGADTHGQTIGITNLNLVKSIAAGANHALAVMYDPLVQYPVDVSRDMLLIYNANTNTTDSTNILSYYLERRPFVANGSLLGLNCSTNETIVPDEYTNSFEPQVKTWLDQNPTKRPNYLILFPDLPSRVNTNTAPDSFPLSAIADTIQRRLRGLFMLKPVVSTIAVGSADACRAYINKLEHFGTNTGVPRLLISASASGYSATNYVIDNVRHGEGCFPDLSFERAGYALSGVPTALLAAQVSESSILYCDGVEVSNQALTHISVATNVTGYICWGFHSSLGSWFPLPVSTNQVRWYGESQWYVMATIGLSTVDSGHSRATFGCGSKRTHLAAPTLTRHPSEH